MAGINSIPELAMLYWILDLYLTGRLEREGDIHEAILYKTKREETGGDWQSFSFPTSGEGPSSVEETRVQLLEMAGINSIPELAMLYWILDLYLTGRLEREGDIHEAILYKTKREETGDPQEATFDPIGQTLVNSQKGYWCYTPLFYDGNGKPIRRVPVGRGSWNLRNTDTKDSSNGVKWCIRKFKYENTVGFKMIQFSLGGKDEQGIACNTRPPLRQLAQEPPGGIADESTDVLQRHANASTNTTIMVAAAPQGPPSHDNSNKKRKLDIRDPSDGSEWTIEDIELIELVEKAKPATGQSMPENPESNAAPFNTRIEDHQSQQGATATPNEGAMHRDPNLSHESYMPIQERLHTNNQDHQRSVASGIDLHPQVEQGLLPDGIIERHANASTNTTIMVAAAPQGPPSYDNSNKKRKLDIRDPSDGSEWTIEDIELIELVEKAKPATGQSMPENPESNAAPFNTRIEDHQSQQGATATPNEGAMHRDPNLSHESYMPIQERLHTNNQDHQRSVASGIDLHPQVEQGLLPDGIIEVMYAYSQPFFLFLVFFFQHDQKIRQ
ncbi:hypothetical protein COCNU_scaffold002497G000010 [Cocos nucifera]|nr:hypothetical protein [Cocos nucifera]